MKKLLYPIAFTLTAFLIFYSCSAEEEDTTPPPSVVATPELEPPAPTQYTLTVTSGEGGSVSTEGGTFDEGTEVTITALPSQGWEFVENNGWYFKGWTGDIQSSDSIITVNINEGINITAVFEQKPFPYSINWVNLIENVEGTSKIVYDKTLETIERNKTIDGYNNVPYKVYRGPNLDDKHYVNFDLWLDDLFGLYAKALKPDSQTFIMFPYEDLEWAVDFLSSEEVNQPLYETVMRNANQNENQQTVLSI